MKAFEGKKKWIVIAAVIAAAAVLAFVLLRRSGGSSGTAYVDTVASLTGQNGALGISNQYAGTVESQETWSVNKNSEVDVKQIFVTEGQSVNEGDPLFEYDTTKYEEDLQEAEIELERMDNEYKSTQETLAQLQKEKQKASASEQANYTVQIQEQELALKDKELDIRLKQNERDKLEKNIETAEVRSELTGVVKSINENGGDEEDSAFITVMKVGDYRIKGSISEQNIGEVTPGASVTIYSRFNDNTWKGTITEIDTENPLSSNSNNFFSGSSADRATRYPFYVEMESSEGLIMGQHVYVQVDREEAEEGIKGIWVTEYLVDMTDPDNPFVWKDVNGRLKKQKVKIGNVDDELGRVQILEGLELTDSIAVPDGTLKEGMSTAPMEEKPADTGEDASGNDAGGMMEEGTENMEGTEGSEMDEDIIIEESEIEGGPVE